MLWIKNRNDGGGPHTLYDTARGNNSGLRTNSADDAETGVNSTQDLTSFNNNGFSLGTGWAENVNYNKEIITGQHRKINLLKEPFKLDNPFFKIQEINNRNNPDEDNFIYIYRN